MQTPSPLNTRTAQAEGRSANTAQTPHDLQIVPPDGPQDTDPKQLRVCTPPHPQPVQGRPSWGPRPHQASGPSGAPALLGDLPPGAAPPTQRSPSPGTDALRYSHTSAQAHHAQESLAHGRTHPLKQPPHSAPKGPERAPAPDSTWESPAERRIPEAWHLTAQAGTQLSEAPPWSSAGASAGLRLRCPRRPPGW